jgi:peptidoglycan/xylan/chitin deacetylase (PgdA/CDA1 family)
MLLFLLLGTLFPCAIGRADVPLAISIDDLMMSTPVPDGWNRVLAVKKVVAALRAEHVPGVRAFVTTLGPGSEASAVRARKVWRESGYGFGNHTASHLDPNHQTPDEFERDLLADEGVLESSAAKTDNWHVFRFPFIHEGGTSEARAALRKVLQKHGYQVAPVSVGFGDFAWAVAYARCLGQGKRAESAKLRDKFVKEIVRQTLLADRKARRLLGRSAKLVLLLHVGGLQADALPPLLKELRKSGVRFVPLDEAIADKVYEQDAGYAGAEPQFFFDRLLQARGGTVDTSGLGENGPKPQELGATCP